MNVPKTQLPKNPHENPQVGNASSLRNTSIDQSQAPKNSKNKFKPMEPPTDHSALEYLRLIDKDTLKARQYSRGASRGMPRGQGNKQSDDKNCMLKY